MKYNNIAEFIQDDLAKSGLSIDNFPVAPLSSEAELLDRLQFKFIENRRIIEIGGYWIQNNGHWRLKLREPIGNIKYLSAKGAGNHAYILPQVAAIARDYNPDKPLFFTEGEKKAAKLTLEGFPCIGLTGVWNFKDSENDFLPELAELNLKNRKCSIIFDSDITDKFNVRHAELRLAVAIINHGGIPVSVRLPNEESGEKNGADDYLVRYGRKELHKLLSTPKPAIETHIEEGLPTDTILKEIAKLDSAIERARIIKLIATNLDIPIGDVRSEVAKHIPKTDEKPASDSAAETFTEEEINAAEALLNNPELLDLAVKQTEKAGHVGETINKKVLILAFISRLLTDAVSCVIKGPSSSGKNALVRAVLTLFPTSVYSDYTSISARALYYKKDQNLAHRILVIYEAHGSEQADYPIRSAISEGKLKLEVTIKNPQTGNFETQLIEISTEGLAYAETTTRERVHDENQTRYLDLNVNESKEMNEAVIKEMGRDAANPRDRKALEKELRIWQCAQTLIKDYPVRIPFAPELSDEYPTYKTRVRRDFPHFLSLIKAHALLYQRQRKVDKDGFLIATIDDLKAVLQLAEKVLTQSLKEMTPKKEYVLAVIRNEYKIGEEFQVKTLLEKLNNYMNYYNYIKSGFILLFPNGNSELNTKDEQLIITYETIYKELKIQPLLDGGRTPVRVEYQTLQGYLKGFAAEGLLDWNGIKGAGSRYSLSTISTDLIINSTIFTPKFIETLENNYINHDLYNSNQSSNYSENKKESASSEPAGEGNNEPKEPEATPEANTAQENTHSEACDCSECCPEEEQEAGNHANGKPFESCDDFKHPDNCDCSYCLITKKRPDGNNTITKTVAVDGRFIRLEYDKQVGVIIVNSNGKTYLAFDHEPEFAEYLQYFNLEGGVH